MQPVFVPDDVLEIIGASCPLLEVLDLDWYERTLNVFEYLPSLATCTKMRNLRLMGEFGMPEDMDFPIFPSSSAIIDVVINVLAPCMPALAHVELGKLSHAPDDPEFKCPGASDWFAAISSLQEVVLHQANFEGEGAFTFTTIGATYNFTRE